MVFELNNKNTAIFGTMLAVKMQSTLCSLPEKNNLIGNELNKEVVWIKETSQVSNWKSDGNIDAVNKRKRPEEKTPVEGIALTFHSLKTDCPEHSYTEKVPSTFHNLHLKFHN